MNSFDAIIIGGGHNGLTTAAYLAKAGLKAVVLEKNDYVGGAATSRSLHPGFTYSNSSYLCSTMRQVIHRDLELSRHGLFIVPYLGTVYFGENNQRLLSYGTAGPAYNEVRKHSKHDADALTRFRADVSRYARLIRKTLMRTPPDPASFRLRDLKEMLFLAREFWSLGEREMYEYLRFFTSSTAEFLDDYFESDLIKAVMASPSLIGSTLGVQSPGSAYILLHHVMGDVDGTIGAWGLARGGMGAISNALKGAFLEHGGEVRTDADVAHVIMRGGKAIGVALTNGDEYYARTIVSNLDAKRTFLKLFDESALSPAIRKRAVHFKTRGSSGKINIALSGLPRFRDVPDNPYLNRGGQGFPGSLDAMERAYDCWKRGRWSDDPFVETIIPSAWDPTMAPPGQHWMSCFVQYCPPTIDGDAWSVAHRDAFAKVVIEKIERYAPGFSQLVEHMEVRTPSELESEIGLTGGNIFHGELRIDQLFFNRPFPGFSQYRTPVGNFYMCGSSTHPGGGVSSACGANAAREILHDLKLQNTVPQDDCHDE